MKLSSRAKIALAVAEKAGQILLAEATRIKKSRKAEGHIGHKRNIATGEQEMVTTVDTLIDNFIIKSIHQNYPKEFLLTEESYKDIDRKKRLKQKSVWIIDPIDGTVDFARFLLAPTKDKQRHSFSICIAWALQGKVRLGIVYAPVLEEIWIAEKDRGTWYRQAKKSWKRLTMKATKNSSLLVATSSHEKTLAENLQRLPGHTLTFPSSLAYRIVGTTVGHHDTHVSFKGGSKEWDVAAADIIVREAGGALVDSQNKLLSYNKKDVTNPLPLVTGHQTTINQLLPLIQPKHSLAIIGCITHSTPTYPDGVRERFGGGVIYGSETAKKLGVDVTVITAGAKDIAGGIAQLTKQGIKAIRLPQKTSNNFSNDYTGPKRILRLSSIMPSSITNKEIQKHAPQVDAWILNPIFHEVTPSLVPAKRNFTVLMDLQGLTRKVKKQPDGYYHLVEHRWAGWKQWKGKIDILRITDEDIKHMAFPATVKTLIQKLIYLVHQGFPLVILTQGSKPTLVVTKRGIKSMPIHKIATIDTAGAGDSFNAGFVAGYLKYRDPIIAAAFGNATAGYMVSGKGTDNVPDLAIVTKKAQTILKAIKYAL